MLGFLLRMLITAIGLAIASSVVPGIDITGARTALGAAFLLGLVNATIRPIAIFLTFPITLVSLGLFLLVINAAMLGLVAAMLQNFLITDLLSALLGSLIVSLTSWLGSGFVGPKGRYEVIVTRSRRS